MRRGNRQTANITGSRPQARATCTHPQQRDPQAQRQGFAQTFAVPVPDARRIWGTLKTTTTRAVEKVIGSLTKVPTSELKIKRKYKTTTDNLKVVQHSVSLGGGLLLELKNLFWSNYKRNGI